MPSVTTARTRTNGYLGATGHPAATAVAHSLAKPRANSTGEPSPGEFEDDFVKAIRHAELDPEFDYLDAMAKGLRG